jgi:endo-1,3-1,4-beta-glycanase ExoK
MTRLCLSSCVLLAISVSSQQAFAVQSAELYSAASYGYGRVEARVRFAPGDGVIGSFFLWKEGSEQPGTFWNELDFEKLGADCHLETNPIYGDPAKNHSQRHVLVSDLCGAFHVYAYEWTPDYIAWLVDDVEVRRETGGAALAYADNAAAGMRIHFNVWPGDATFGGNFSPDILPVHEYVDWVQFSYNSPRTPTAPSPGSGVKTSLAQRRQPDGSRPAGAHPRACRRTSRRTSTLSMAMRYCL